MATKRAHLCVTQPQHGHRRCGKQAISLDTTPDLPCPLQQSFPRRPKKKKVWAAVDAKRQEYIYIYVIKVPIVSNCCLLAGSLFSRQRNSKRNMHARTTNWRLLSRPGPHSPCGAALPPWSKNPEGVLGKVVLAFRFVHGFPATYHRGKVIHQIPSESVEPSTVRGSRVLLSG